jgi:hypothetical protein
MAMTDDYSLPAAAWKPFDARRLHDLGTHFKKSTLDSGKKTGHGGQTGCIVPIEESKVADGVFHLFHLSALALQLYRHWVRTMRKLVLLITACAFGLGGYQLGRQPNSPDIWGWLTGKADQVDWSTAQKTAGGAFAAAQERLAAWFPSSSAADKPADKSGETQPATPANATPPVACQAEARSQAPPVPQCW